MEKIKLDVLRIDGGTQIRVVVDQSTVYRYVECIKEGDIFPPIEARFDGVNYWMSGGFHRWHAYKILGIKEVEVNWKPGTLQDAILDALASNSDHGKPLTNEDKHKKVVMALAIPGYGEKSDYEIAKICRVSRSFVAAVRDPKAKERQEKNWQKSAEKKLRNSSSTTSPEPASPKKPDPHAGVAPDDDEIKATELAHQADIEAMYKLLEADEPLKEAHEEIKRLNHLNAQLEIRINGLINEKTEAIKEVKKLQKQLEKMKEK